MEETSEKLKDLAERAYREFTDVSDYIWKSPRLIEHETKLEVKKLHTYFPNAPEHAKIRWHFESNKLNRVFPYLIAIGNLFSVLSLFESYLLLLATELEKLTNIPTNSARGQGVTRLFSYLKGLGLDLDQIEPYNQVQAAIKIRNCLSHASGLLAWSREELKLKQLQKTGTYLSKEHRKMRKANGGEFDEVRIVTSDLGERLQVNNEYAFVVSSYLRDFFVDVCQAAVLLNETDNEKFALQ